MNKAAIKSDSIGPMGIIGVPSSQRVQVRKIAISMNPQQPNARPRQQSIDHDPADMPDEHRPGDRGHRWKNQPPCRPKHELIQLPPGPLGEQPVPKVVQHQRHQQKQQVKPRDDDWHAVKNARQADRGRDQQPEMQAHPNPNPRPKRHRQTQYGRRIAEIIPRPTASIIITILPAQRCFLSAKYVSTGF